jgi:hypothetical protein
VRNANSVAYVWVMIASNNSDGWTQSGYVYRDGVSGAYTFAQYSENGSAWYTVYGSTISSTALYYESYNFTAGAMDLVANGTQLETTPWDPDLEWTAPWIPEWEGETHYTGDDVPGTSASPAYVSNMGIITSRGGSVTDPSGLSVSSTYSNYAAAWDTSQSEFHIWSKS